MNYVDQRHSENVLTRIVNLGSRKCITLYPSGDRRFWHTTFDPASTDNAQWWKLVRYDNAGKYMIISANTGEAIVSSDHGEWISQPRDSNLQIQIFRFDQGTDTRSRHFKIVCPNSNMRTVSNSDLYNEPNNSSLKDEQYWQFITEEMEITAVNYILPAGNPFGRSPLVIDRQIATNNLSTTQTMSVTISGSTENQSSFDASAGFSTTVSTDFKCGVPGIAEGKVSVSATASTELKWGKVNKTTLQWSKSVPLEVPPGKTYRVIGSVDQTVMDIPFTATLTSKITGKTTTMTGVYKGVTNFNFTTTYDDVTGKPI
ncbi:hypothetical protein BELL_0835g00040 [Botrytis elliptica]|uniref:Ricin B lectin domain-containing protein n=1 Tax=Botrytis elliptica TaxID=278938 RepID=A0A4Z1JGF4_9HELO|nr:hypothetical protein BELL_0835g00040 [Botrytis elliptica]